jgi:DNA-directed RNA polymerase specialized sigma24 family protein
LRSGGRNELLDTMALVHEVYLKLSRAAGLSLPDRLRFLVYASRFMRSIIVDLVRQKQSQRHGGEYRRLTLTGDLIDEAGLPAQEDYILRVHEALDEMAKVDERMARVVEMRHFTGMTDLEISAAPGCAAGPCRTAHAVLNTLPKVETAQFAPQPAEPVVDETRPIGPYRLLRELGSGGMATVWRSWPRWNTPTSPGCLTRARRATASLTWRWNTCRMSRSTTTAVACNWACRSGCRSSCRWSWRWPKRMHGWWCTAT